MNPYLSGALLIIISAVAFGAMPIFARFAYAAGADPVTLLLLRFTTAGLFLLAWTWIRRLPLPKGRTLAAVIGMGLVGYFGQAMSYFTALTLIPAGLVALLLYLYPALVTGMSAVLFKERLTPLRGAALLLSLSGAALVIAPAGRVSESGPIQPLGIFLALLAAVVYSGYILVSSRVMRSADPVSTSMVIMLSAAVSFGLLAAARGLAGEGLHLPQTGGGWWALGGLALVSTVLAMVTFLAGVARVGPTNASLLSTLEPVVSVILAMLLLGESLAPVQAVGGALILAAVLALTGLENKTGVQKAAGPAG
jgi:drug/metabolite transporter (DMT)-like permease